MINPCTGSTYMHHHRTFIADVPRFPSYLCCPIERMIYTVTHIIWSLVLKSWVINQQIWVTHGFHKCMSVVMGKLPKLGNITPDHGDVIKWKYFPRHWPFVRGIHRSQVNSPHKGQWRGALMFSLICVWINGWVNNREAGDLRRYRTYYDVTVMIGVLFFVSNTIM